MKKQIKPSRDWPIEMVYPTTLHPVSKTDFTMSTRGFAAPGLEDWWHVLNLLFHGTCQVPFRKGSVIRVQRTSSRQRSPPAMSNKAG